MKLKPVIIAALALACPLPAFAETKPKPLKVYILAGQSNATGMARTRTLEHLKMSPETAKEYADVFDKDGKPTTLEAVYVTQWKGKEGGRLQPIFGGSAKGQTAFGPEYGWGIYLHKELNEPFLIIKTSQGGKSLNYDFRSPSSGKWTPPPGHPDLIKPETAEVKKPTLAVPQKMEIANDWKPEKIHTLRRRHLGLDGFKGAEVGKIGDVYPIYILSATAGKIKGDPFQAGDLILAVDGAGLDENPVDQWRDAFHGSRSIDGDWMIKVTRWRAGKIETFDFDICDTLPGGRPSLPQEIDNMKQAAIEHEKQRGAFYNDMITHVKSVLSDVKKHHPAYDPAAGYELAGFAWFQGWNDMIDTGTYPNRDKPNGYEQYTWLLENLIRDMRKDLNAPNMPAVIGVMGIGGVNVEGNIGNFQKAQMAVAEKSEFKGNVIAVETGKYWDHELAKLVEKSNITNQQMSVFRNEQGLEGEALKKAFTEHRAKHITPEEEAILKTGVSDGDFHYLGSAKIMVGIGRGFAEALAKTIKK
jgi:Carbohydrate esterase, sialic acid-specific acetylesterase